jgi:hypothetical protein
VDVSYFVALFWGYDLFWYVDSSTVVLGYLLTISGCFAPKGWEITEIAAVVPMAMTLISHALLPFLLNPSLMIFNY